MCYMKPKNISADKYSNLFWASIFSKLKATCTIEFHVITWFDTYSEMQKQSGAVCLSTLAFLWSWIVG